LISTHDELLFYERGKVNQEAQMTGTRGPRPAGSGTREAIAAAARHQFAEHGYPGTTLRSVAREAGVDTRLVTHYFGSKQALFATVVELPFDPASALDQILRRGPDDAGTRLAQFLLSVLESPGGRRTVTGMLRAAASEDAAAAMIRDLLVERILTPLTQRIGGDAPELRASLLGSQIAGLAFARHVVGLPRLVQADPATLVAALAPALQHYLTGPIAPTVDAPADPPDA
jgi:AcrR family transcriptional regulator